jgi:hypothetical protein
MESLSPVLNRPTQSPAVPGPFAIVAVIVAPAAKVVPFRLTVGVPAAVTVNTIGTESSWLAVEGDARPRTPTKVPGVFSDAVFTLRFTDPGAAPLSGVTVTLGSLRPPA